ncbi:MAG: energy transducer TonB [Verrucomicrobia bacterium]|nr:energy transducer TonB [Verrucomicrobiota bacterium]
MAVAAVMGTSLGEAGRVAATPLNLDAAAALEQQQPNEGPVLIAQVAPEYPPALRRAGVKGEVVVAFTVEIDGRVTDLEILRASQPGFEAPALAAVRQWRFKAARKNGVVVPARVVQTLVFAPDAAEPKQRPAPVPPEARPKPVEPVHGPN